MLWPAPQAVFASGPFCGPLACPAALGFCLLGSWGSWLSSAVWGPITHAVHPSTHFGSVTWPLPRAELGMLSLCRLFVTIFAVLVFRINCKGQTFVLQCFLRLLQIHLFCLRYLPSILFYFVFSFRTRPPALWLSAGGGGGPIRGARDSMGGKASSVPQPHGYYLIPF